MSADDEPIFNYLCRTCLHELTNIKPQQWQSIFNPTEECGGLSIADVLFNTMPQLKVQPSDELPRKICHECLQSLLSAYRFQQQCLQSQQQILKIIAKERAASLSMVLIKSEDEQPLPEDREEGTILDFSIEINPTQSTAPLKSQNSNEEIENYLNSQSDSESIKNEPCDYEPNSDCSDGKCVTIEPCSDNETNVECSTEETMATFKDEVLTLETVEEQVSLSSSESMKSEPVQLHRLVHIEKISIKPLRNFCDICKKQFSKPYSLARHKKLRHSTEEIKIEIPCDRCNKTYNTLDSLERHKRIRHYEKKPLKEELQRPSCGICGKTFSKYQNLRNHELGVHATEKSYLCPECGKTFKTAVLLIQHSKRHLLKTHECPHCPLKFVCRTDVTKHAKIHTSAGIKQHICNICDARVSSACELRLHYQRHSGEKPYKCDYCEMCFLTVNHRRRHMRTHTGEKPYQCEYCDRAFAQKGEHTKHLRTHLVNHRRRHMRTHTGEKPYQCEYCDRAFAQKGEHTKHLRTHLGKNVYRCKLCPLAFRFASELRVHFTTHKNEDPETRERNMKALKEEEDKLQLKFAKKDA